MLFQFSCCYCYCYVFYQLLLKTVRSYWRKLDWSWFNCCLRILCWSWSDFDSNLKSALAASKRLSTLGIWRRKTLEWPSPNPILSKLNLDIDIDIGNDIDIDINIDAVKTESWEEAKQWKVISQSPPVEPFQSRISEERKHLKRES